MGGSQGKPFGDRENKIPGKGGLICYADLPVLAIRLVAVARCGCETIEMALLRLSFSVKRGQSVLEALGAKAVRESVTFRISVPPCVVASNALVLHRPLLVIMVPASVDVAFI